MSDRGRGWSAHRPGSRHAWSRPPTALAALSLVAVALAGCTDQQPGTPQAGTTAPAAASGVDWAGSAAIAALGSIPATFDAKFHIALLDPASLNLVGRIGGDAGPTTAPSTGGRPPAESAWLNNSTSNQVCAAVLDDRSAPAVRTAPPDKMLSVWFNGTDAEQELGVCQGAIDAGRLGDPELRDGAVTAQTVAGVNGFRGPHGWAGYRESPPVTYLVGSDVPDDTRTAVLDGSAVSGSLAEDRQVRAVLDEVPHAAMVDMGTVYLQGNPPDATDEITAALSTAMRSAGVTQLPVADFVGYGWTPGTRRVGTATFVTTYGSTQEAQAVGAVLSALWPALADTAFAGAGTTVDGQVVVTTMADVGAAEFSLRDRTILDYPALVSGS